ncbi:hypothetical protein [Mesorhizobium ventifaucium]|uniref:Uncharacterized protein n=1 Tax=Mesorhizobium ventifaucium TaxID=666020 RepID=A0ABM9DFI9_9HYPH|nr:hypothetical protein [Mesorhizobium ventifaucium]CAH2394578.1 conserved hypothetical protein [Mesorhizobium ventifaucium]
MRIPERIRVHRRGVLWLLGGGLVSTVLAYDTMRSFFDEDLVRVTLTKYLDDFEMTKEDLRAFVSEFRKRRPWTFPTKLLADASTLLETRRLGRAARGLLPDEDAQELDRFERWVLADFHLLTDYAQRAEPSEPVQYIGFQPCANPFAKFEPAKQA